MSLAGAALLSVLLFIPFISSAAAQDDRLKARPEDFQDSAGEFDVVSYLTAGAAIADAAGVVPGQSVEVTIEGFDEGEIITIVIANPVTLIGRYTVGANGSLTKIAGSPAAKAAQTSDTIAVEIPAGYREGYAEIIASSSDPLSDNSSIVSSVAVYVTSPDSEIVTKSLGLSVDSQQLIALSDLARTGRNSVELLGMAVVLIMAGVILVDLTRTRRRA